MNDLTALRPVNLPANVTEMTNESLRQLFADRFGAAADSLREMAYLLWLLESRGEDVSEMCDGGLLRMLMMVASGRTTAEVLCRFMGKPDILRKVISLPMREQTRLAAGEPVRLIVLRDGGYDAVNANPLHLRGNQVKQVFGDGEIRSDAEQRTRLESLRTKAAIDVPAKAKRQPGIYLDFANGVGRVRGQFTLAEMAERLGFGAAWKRKAAKSK